MYKSKNGSLVALTTIESAVYVCNCTQYDMVLFRLCRDTGQKIFACVNTTTPEDK
jgi:hypothetical protein